MLLERISDRLVEENSLAFSIYADYYHAKKWIINRKAGEETDEKDLDRPINSLQELCDLAEKRHAIFYGRDILKLYKEDPEHTVLFVTHELTLTGAPIVLLNLIKSFMNRGWQVLVISCEDGRLGNVAAEEGIPVIVMPELFSSNLPSCIRTLFRAVVVNTIESSPIIQQLNGSDTPVIWWIHESKAVYGKKNARLMPRSLSDNIHVYCVGEYARRMLIRRAPRYRTDILMYHANDLEKIINSNMPGDEINAGKRKVFLTVGVISKRKGQDVLLEAINLLPNTIRDQCCFVFAGAAEDERMEEEIIRKCKEEPDLIIYHGELEREKIYDLYNECNYLVCSSRDDPMPVVIAEAMSLGKPCICSSETGFAAIIKEFESGRVYEHNSPQKLARLIAQSFDDSDEDYRVLSSNARQAYETYFSESVFEDRVREIE